MTVFLSILLLLALVLLGLSLYFNYKHAVIIVELQDALESSLDILDEGYRKLSDLLDTPIMMDSPEVHQMVFQVKRMRDSVLYISNRLVEPYGGIIEEEEEDGKS